MEHLIRLLVCIWAQTLHVLYHASMSAFFELCCELALHHSDSTVCARFAHSNVLVSSICICALAQSELGTALPGFTDLFEVHDIHTNTHTLSLQKPGAEELYVGFLDGVVVPKRSLELIRQMRLGIELKHNPADKARYKQGGQVHPLAGMMCTTHCC